MDVRGELRNSTQGSHVDVAGGVDEGMGNQGGKDFKF